MYKRTVDLTSCDTEPIHIIGAIQPNGALIAADEKTLIVGFASANTADFLARTPSELLGRPLVEILGEAACASLLSRSLAPSQPDLLRPWNVRLPRADGEGAGLECFPHRHGGRLILEFVHAEDGPAVMWEDDRIRQQIISEMIRPQTLTELADVGAGIVRDVTGFDRVMVYCFAPDKHGEVIAESTARDDSFLGLHYPASDIPDPARRHFALNVIRVIPDIHAAPVPILTRSGAVAGAGSLEPLDLTFSKLRAVAPVHVEYLSNMQVGASMSISLIANGELWGLVACHHYGPLPLSWSKLRFCELIGGTISALLQSLENTIQLRHAIRAEKTAFDIEHQARLGRPLHDVIVDHADLLMEQCGAQGLSLRLNGRMFSAGTLPDPPLDPAALQSRLVDGVAVCDDLSGLAETDRAVADDGIAGAAMMELSSDGEDWLVLFRDAFEQAIHWAGRPEKTQTLGEDGTVRLSPRGSFALWREERRGRSKPFTEVDREILRITRRALFAVNSLDRERAADAARRQAEGEEARLRLMLLDAARERMIGELASALAHELNQPLSAVTNYVNACRRELMNYGMDVPDDLGRLMDSAVSESSRAADLVRRLRNFIGQGEIAFEPSDLHAIVRQGAGLALAADGDPPPEVVFVFDGQMAPVSADPVQIAQVVLNLTRNSLAAMRQSPERILSFSTRRLGAEAEISVADTGAGIAKALETTLFEPFHSSTTSGMGIGLSLCRSIVEAHGGRIWVRPTRGRTEIVFTLRIAEDCDDRDE